MGYWGPYVPVAQRRAQAEKHLQKAKASGKILNPVVIAGKQIANTFWGKAWCDHMETYSDYANRLPRGRTYVRNGSVLHLQISKGEIYAQVMGSYLYQVTIQVKAMAASKWTNLVKACSGKIDSLIELLQGRFSDGVMSQIIDKQNGLFPRPNEIELDCSCPDGVGMCKHSAAVLYGIGACLDQQPEKLFLLRHVDHLELIAQATADGITSKPSKDALDESDLSSVFGIEMAPVVTPQPQREEQIKLSLPQAATLLNLSAARLNKLLANRTIQFHRAGKGRWIAFEEILRYRQNRKRGPAKKP